MRAQHRGFTIEATREPCMAGYDLTYFSACREGDGYVAIDGLSEDNAPLRQWIQRLRRRVDEIMDGGELT